MEANRHAENRLPARNICRRWLLHTPKTGWAPWRIRTLNDASANHSVPGQDSVGDSAREATQTGPGKWSSVAGWVSLRPVEIALLILLAVFSVGVTLSVLFSSVDLYYPADAAHYVADADALMGHGVREIRHPPLFPAMVALAQPFGGAVGAFQFALAVSLFLLPISLHFLLRQWLPPVPSLVGAALGSMTPPVGELVGWAGGSTLIGLDCMILALAFLEMWIRVRGRQGLFVGLFIGLAGLSHPFVLAAAVFLVLVRWAFDAAARRSFGRDWGPLGLKGIGSTVAVAFGLLLLSIDYYLRLTTVGQGTTLNVDLPASLLAWSTRENAFLIFFLLLGLFLPLPLDKRGLMILSGSVGVLFVAIPLLAPWDVSYSSRVVYFLPIPFGIGGALLGHLILEQTRSTARLRRLEVPLIVALLLVAPIGAAYGLGYTQRLGTASVYYQRIHAVDLPAFDYLRGGTGTVATSWTGAFQDQGSVNAWFVQGLSKRAAFGPGAPWLSTLTELGPGDSDMERLFAGSVGLENGNLQITGTRTGGLRDPAVNVGVGGFYYPSLYVNSYANAYPIAVEEGVNVTTSGDALMLRHPAVQSSGELLQESRLDPGGVNITFSLVGTSASTGNWSIWVWPAYYRPWEEVQSVEGHIETTQTYRSGVVTTRVEALTPGSSLLFFDADPRWGLQAIEVEAQGVGSIAIRISAQGGDPAGAIVSFDESTLLARYGVTDVLLWKDTGWEARFDVSSRFHRSFETDDLIVYTVMP